MVTVTNFCCYNCTFLFGIYLCRLIYTISNVFIVAVIAAVVTVIAAFVTDTS